MSKVLQSIPARYRRLVYLAVAIAGAVVPVLAQAGVISADGAKQIGSIVAALTAAMAGANVTKA